MFWVRSIFLLLIDKDFNSSNNFAVQQLLANNISVKTISKHKLTPRYNMLAQRCFATLSNDKNTHFLCLPPSLNDWGVEEASCPRIVGNNQVTQYTVNCWIFIRQIAWLTEKVIKLICTTKLFDFHFEIYKFIMWYSWSINLMNKLNLGYNEVFIL